MKKKSKKEEQHFTESQKEFFGGGKCFNPETNETIAVPQPSQPQEEEWEEEFWTIWNNFDDEGFHDTDANEIRDFISQQREKAIQEGYNRGRIKCLEQGGCLETTKAEREKVIKEIEELRCHFYLKEELWAIDKVLEILNKLTKEK